MVIVNMFAHRNTAILLVLSNFSFKEEPKAKRYVSL